MTLSGEKNAPHPEDINDDLARETHFYEQALATANAAIRKLKDLGVATRRPDDFYAEMVKSDEHMKRVRAELIFEQTSLETREERRKAREQKRYGKQVQAEKLKERTLQKKESIKSLDKWRKQRAEQLLGGGCKGAGGLRGWVQEQGFAKGRSGPRRRLGRAGVQKRKFGFGGRRVSVHASFPPVSIPFVLSFVRYRPHPRRRVGGAHPLTPSALGHPLIYGGYPS